jgi:CheY-like chemotaxis protein
MTPAAKSVRVLVVDDNPVVRDLMARALESICEVSTAADGADGLLQAIDRPPDLIVSDFKMPGLDGRQLYEKLHAREATRGIPFIFVASRADIEEKIRPMSDAVEDVIVKPFFVRDLVRRAKKTIDRLHLEKLQQQAARPGVIQGRLEEMGVTELMQSLEMGQKSCRLTLRHAGEQCELYFGAGQCKHAKRGEIEGDEAVYEAITWADGEFEIDFNATSDRVTTTLSTTGLLMEAMRRMDEAAHDSVKD